MVQNGQKWSKIINNKKTWSKWSKMVEMVKNAGHDLELA